MRTLFLTALYVLTLWGDAHIFVFHRFGDEKHASTNTSIDVLKKQFDYFKNNGYDVIPMQRLSKALHDGEKIPDNWVVLNIDDSYKSFYKNGLPLFKKYNYPFTLFVYIEATEKGYGDFMSWEQIRDASQYGEIALHSYGHHHMVSMEKNDVVEDTRRAYNIFTEKMGFEPKYYAYPYGEFSPQTKRAVTSFGFELVCNQNSGAVNENSDPYDLDRIALTGDVNLKPKLAIKALNAQWIAPKIYPDDGNLKSIHAKIAPTITHAEYYVSGYGWEPLKVNNGDVNLTVNRKLKFSRNRIFLKSGRYQSSTILVKE